MRGQSVRNRTPVLFEVFDPAALSGCYLMLERAGKPASAAAGQLYSLKA
jgi:hypothetical protein